MKNFYYTFLFLGFSLMVSSQDLGGTQVEGLIPITRINKTPKATNSNTIGLSEATMQTSASTTTTPSPTGTSSEVGITEGQLSVSLSGGASYAIPIAVPPGINGVVPQVSLVYNSQGGNGIAGYGWNISGVSAITRIPRTKFHDGVVEGVNLDANDRFALDGQRLILKSSTPYGAAGAVYETESFSNIKITSLGTSSSDPNPSFKVEYPDGSIAIYGASLYSRSITTWGITYWENPQGVRISYNYILANNNLSIEYIKYGSTGANTPINQIQFVYGARIRPEQSFIGGQSILMNTILKEIKTSGNSVGFRNYVLEQLKTSETLEYERLMSVTEKSGDGSKTYNPTLFTYENTSESISYLDITTSLSVGNITSQNAGTVSGDFDGDEKMEFLLYPTTGASSKSKYWLFSGIESENYANLGYEHNVGTFETIFPVSWLTWTNKLWTKQGWAVAKKTDTNYTFTIYCAGITNPIYYQYERVVNFPTQTIGAYADYCTTVEVEAIFPKKILSGDFNGDGLTDVVAIDLELQSFSYSDDYYYGCMSSTETITSKKVYFVDLKRDNTSNFLTYSGELASVITASSKVEVADVNGDGKSDFMVFENGKVTTYTLNSLNQLVFLWNYPDTNISIESNKTILLGDFNGDGKTDFIIPKGYGYTEWHKYSSTGNNFNKEVQNCIGVTFEANNSTKTYNYTTSDYNKDGKSDLILTKSILNSTNTLGMLSFVCYINKNGYFRGGSSIYSMWTDSPYLSDIKLNALPIYLPTGRGIPTSGKPYNPTLEIAFLSNNKVFYFNSEKDNTKDQLLRAITTGNGVRESITYKPLSPDSLAEDGYTPIYTPSLFTENYPQTDIESAATVQVVTKLEKQSASVYKKQFFSYAGATSNLEGLGYLGFRASMRTNWFENDAQIISSVSKFDPNLRGANVANYTCLGLYSPTIDVNTVPSNNLISKSLSFYEAILSPTKVYTLQNTQSDTYNILENTSGETNTVYDVYNNPTESISIIRNGGANQQTTTTTVSYQAPTPSPLYAVGRPASKTQTVSLTGDSMTSKEVYGYGSGTESNLLKTIQKWGNNTSSITEANLYDTFGNITKKTISAAGIADRVTNYKYDPAGRFLEESYDIETLKTTYVYNPNGTLQSETNPYGLTTSYLYDSWFKKTTVTDYLGKIRSFGYVCLNGISTITSTGDAIEGSKSEEVYDELGRKTRSGIKDLQNNMSYKDFKYDIYDRNYSTSEPHTGTASLWNTTTYDVYGRPETVTDFKGKVMSMVYDKLTTTITDGSTLTTKKATKNAMGNVAQMEETPGGIIKYSYFANGNLKETDYATTKITLTQDDWGRKTSLVDPSAGTYTYEYSALGEMTKEITPNGITTYDLDDWGKPETKTIVGLNTDSNTAYTYNSVADGKLLIKTVYTDAKDALNTITTDYTYDAQKRLTITKETTGYGAIFTKTLSYDAWGRVATETSKAELNGKSSEKVIQNDYKNGFAYKITDTQNPKILWETKEVNARGQLTKATLGNGIGIVNTYDNSDFGYLTETTHTFTATSAEVMKLTNDFDLQRGNLNWRENSLFGNARENFTYDNQDRLLSYPNALGAIVSQTYEADGRIKTNTLGTYNYANTAKKYQNTSVTLSPEATGYYASRQGIFGDSMEDKKGWSKNAHNPSCISFDDTNAHLGKNSLKINTTGYTVSYVQSDLLIPINNTAATEYTFSGWVKSDNSTAQLTLFKYEENKTTYTTESVNTTALGNWVFITKTVVVPANSKYLNLRVDNIGTGNVWFDDVMIRKTANTALVNLQVPNDTYKDRKLTIDYNTFKSPVTISEAGVDKLSFVYNDNNSRSVMFYGSLDDTKTARPNRKYYSADGTMEIKVTPAGTEFVTYLGGDGYSAPVVYKKTFTATTTQEQMLYLHRDYQGSIIAITNDVGAVLEKRQFDAWGAIIQVQDGAGNVLNGLTILDRGYTGHEHLQSVGLINMNGRLYDPKLHRFLQPDNYVQDPSNTQNFNRYGYVLNNPLKYTDPSGERWKINWNDIIAAVAIVVGVVMVVASAGTLTPISSGLIGAGLAHFGATFAEYTRTGDWNAASNNAGINFSYSQRVDWLDGSKNDKNGIDDDGYQNVTPIKNKPVENKPATVPCVMCHHTLDKGEVFDSELFQPESRFENGLKNTTFGLVGAFSSAAYMISSEGIGVAAGGSTAFTLSLSSIGLGMNQMYDSFSRNPDLTLHSVSTGAGYIAAKNGSQYTQLIDSGAGLLSGSISGGNISGAFKAYRGIQQGEHIIYNGLMIYSTGESYWQFWYPIIKK